MSNLEALVRGFYSAMNEWDVDSVMDYFTDDIKIITVSKRVLEKPKIRDWISQGKDVFPDREITIERIMTKDNVAMVEYTWTATHTGEYLGYPATNNRIELPCVDILEFESDKIKYTKNIFNWKFMERGINPQK